MSWVAVLEAEHRLIERVLSALEARLAGTGRGPGREGPLGPRELADFVRFLRGYADAVHHGKEERILFRALAVTSKAGELGPMLEGVEREHETARMLVDDLEAEARRERWDAEQRAVVARLAAEYVTLLRHHIAYEDGELFPACDACLDPARRRGLERAFAAFDRSHEDRLRALTALGWSLAATAGSPEKS